MKKTQIGVVATGLYLPQQKRSAAEIAELTLGTWTAEAVSNKLGIKQIYVAGPEEGTQEMGALAALDCIRKTDIKAEEIDLILCFGEEWKEYPLTTSALYIQDRVGAVNAWGIDVQNRCCTTICALEMARLMMLASPELQTVLLCGGYRNGDLVDYTDKNMSMMYNLSAGAGAILLRKNWGYNSLLSAHIIADGSLARTAGVEIGGINQPISKDNLAASYKSLRLMEADKMKERLNAISLPNWLQCVDRALAKEGLSREAIDYLAVLHMKRSGHLNILAELGLREDQSVYLENFGHMGQVDMILSLSQGLAAGMVKEGSLVCSLAAGIGYVWAANLIRWGKTDG